MRRNIRYICISHPGKVRKVNQDNFICDGQYMEPNDSEFPFPVRGVCLAETRPLFGVFDGMGGEQCGEAAAHIAARCAARLHVCCDSIQSLVSICHAANQSICDYSDEHHISSAGTTAAMLLFMNKHVLLCNIGDSKVFRFRSEKLEQLSTDHLCVAPFGVKPPLSQNLGISPKDMRIEPYARKFAYKTGDIYLICSDGLTDMVTNEEISKVLASTSLQHGAQQLVGKALENGGRDNITLLLCKVEKEPFRLFSNKPPKEREE